MSGGPVFVGGLSHAGKTQLRIALDAHSQIAMTRRTYMWTDFYERFGDLGLLENLDRCLAAMAADDGIRELGPDFGEIRREFVEGETTYGRLFALVHRQHAARLGKPRWGDQLGLAEAFADRIFEAYPDAVLIHMVRDPRTQRLRGGLRNAGSLGWAVARWRFSADLAARNERMHAGRYRVVRFESLMSEPEATLQSIAAFIGEAYEPAMVEAMPIVGASGPGSLQDRSAVAFVRRYAGSRLDALGYPADDDRATAGQGLAVVGWPASRVAMLAWDTVGAPVIMRRAQR